MFKHSESLVKLAPALAKAQKSFQAATKDSNNPFFKSKYADLGACVDACYPSLNDNGISLLQPVVLLDSGQSVVVTTLLHESGEWLSGSQPIIVAKQNDPQSFGAAVTYARRFALSAMVGLKTEDDDGNTASGRSYSGQSTGGYPSQGLTNKPSPTPAASAPVVAADSSLPWPETPVAVTEEPVKKKNSFERKKPVVKTDDEL